jgi:sensor histidine kinase YesM
MIITDTASMFEKNLELTVVYEEIGAIGQELEIYLSTNSSESLLSFYDHTNIISRNANKIMDNSSYSERGIKLKNIANMINNYLIEADRAVNAKRGRNIEVYTEAYKNTVRQNKYITSYIEGIMSGDLIDSSSKYEDIRDKEYATTYFNNILLGVSISFVIIAIIIFSYEITRPIVKLSEYAKEISYGNFEVHIPPANISGEIDVLYRAFNLMVINIKEYVDQIEEKRRLEKSFNKQRLNNLKMEHALKESELLALQSQVNPHFIFNTINIGAKIAMLQGDKITCSYLENVADIFRYNLKGLETRTTIKDEINNVVAYINLLQTRFGDGIAFDSKIYCDESLLDTEIPRMTLQPLVENAYIHGISECENGGEINLEFREDSESIYIYIIDNGKGITKERIKELLYTTNQKGVTKKAKIGHTTGIGVDNVLQRLRLYFNKTDVLNIECEDGKTKFIIKVPKLIKNI